jgi:hypothetical protein
MRVRNALLRPPFVMYYLTFLVPEVQSILARHGFSVEVKELPGRSLLVIGTLEADSLLFYGSPLRERSVYSTPDIMAQRSVAFV